jgi:hypothetical protein
MKDTHTTEEVAKGVYNLLMSGSFETWYEDVFMDHVEGAEDADTIEEVHAWLEQMIKIRL